MTYEQIEELRQKLSISRERFATLLGIQLATYYGWSQETRRPSKTATMLLKLLESDPEEMRNRLAYMKAGKKRLSSIRDSIQNAITLLESLLRERGENPDENEKYRALKKALIEIDAIEKGD